MTGIIRLSETTVSYVLQRDGKTFKVKFETSDGTEVASREFTNVELAALLYRTFAGNMGDPQASKEMATLLTTHKQALSPSLWPSPWFDEEFYTAQLHKLCEKITKENKPQ